jgi:glucose-6-phosphate-specific signal transduction histidine kinase
MHIALPDDVEGPEDHAAVPGDDVAAAVYLALARLSSVIAGQSVKIDVAVRPGLKVAMRAAALADTLEELLAVALQAAPASRMLLTAVAEGDRVAINVVDDMPGGDPAVRLNRARTLRQRVATRGDSITVEVRPKEGTTMTLRLACAAAAAQASNAAPGAI